MSQAHRTAPWKKIAKQRRELGRQRREDCALCGKPIDWDGPYYLPTSSRRRRNPWYGSVEHTDIHTLGGTLAPDDLDALTCAHLHCQSVQGQWARRAAIARGQGQPIPPPPTYTGPPGHPQATHTPTTPPPPSFHHPTTDSGDEDQLITPGGRVPLPRFVSGSHPDAVGSLGGECLEWIAERRRADDMVPDGEKDPLPWWGLVLERALEVDASGRLVWRQVCLTVPRQSGKSTLLGELLMWRVSQAARFGEPQLAAHVGNNLQAALRTQQDLHAWARGEGFKVALRTGAERITLPDSSCWQVTSLSASYGLRASLVALDECFDVARGPVEKALLPTQARRRSPQVWMVSSANEQCTDLMPHYMRLAREGSSRVCLFDWGLPEGGDPLDESLWALSNPHPTPEYVAEVAAHRGTTDWQGQWLNVWPSPEEQVAEEGWISAERWGALRVAGVPAGGRVTVAVESSQDGRLVAVARAVVADDRVTVDAAEVGTVAEMRQLVSEWWEPSGGLVVGRSLAGLMDARWQARPVSQGQYAGAVAVFRSQLDEGLLAHTGSPVLDEQVPRMVLQPVGPAGAILTGSGVHVGRCAVWATWAAVSRKAEFLLV